MNNMDIFTAKKRSQIMSRIRSEGTKPEECLFEIVRQSLDKKTRIKRNSSDLLGRPDIFIPSLSLVIFMDGCFFHGCPIHGRIPKTNVKYWTDKISSNLRRDKRVRRRLRNHGMAVYRFWEHELKHSMLSRTAARVSNAIERCRNR